MRKQGIRSNVRSHFNEYRLAGSWFIMQDGRTIRIQALQLLCQFDAGNEDVPCITTEPFDEDTSETQHPHDDALKLATAVWSDRTTADAHIEPLTPEWPIHRQPLVDRNILRLARYEIVTSMTPPIVAIDEAIELARMFSTEKSPAFVNGVLDKLFQDSKSTEVVKDGEP
jgi:N utilization substance protein B